MKLELKISELNNKTFEVVQSVLLKKNFCSACQHYGGYCGNCNTRHCEVMNLTSQNWRERVKFI